MSNICPNYNVLKTIKIDSFCNINLYFFGQHVKMMSTQFLVDNMYLFKMQRHFRSIVEKKSNKILVIKKSNIFV